MPPVIARFRVFNDSEITPVSNDVEKALRVYITQTIYQWREDPSF